MGAGYARAEEVITALAGKGLFRAKELAGWKVSRAWLERGLPWGWTISYGGGVWGHPDARPTLAELVQCRYPRAVFCGRTALWLHGLGPQPPLLEFAVGPDERYPRPPWPGVVACRLKEAEEDVVTRPGDRRLLELRLHSPERALVDVARVDGADAAQRALRPLLERSACPVSALHDVARRLGAEAALARTCEAVREAVREELELGRELAALVPF